jgi:hypothetical protein
VYDSARPAILPTITASTDFAVLGAEASKANDSNLTTSGFSVHYDAASKDYVIDVPASQPGAFRQYVANTPSDQGWGGALVPASGHQFDGVFVRKPSAGLALSYTTFADYGYLYQGVPSGVLAFGVATSAGGVPASGSATYGAIVDGVTIDGNGLISGDATLQFDFGAGKLSGHFDPSYGDFGGMGEVYALGRYDFTSTVFGAGSTTFSGQLSNAQFSGKGAFNGQFTGPHAEELMARWSAPYINPLSHASGTMFGVWIGKH